MTKVQWLQMGIEHDRFWRKNRKLEKVCRVAGMLVLAPIAVGIAVLLLDQAFGLQWFQVVLDMLNQ